MMNIPKEISDILERLTKRYEEITGKKLEFDEKGIKELAKDLNKLYKQGLEIRLYPDAEENLISVLDKRDKREILEEDDIEDRESETIRKLKKEGYRIKFLRLIGYSKNENDLSYPDIYIVAYPPNLKQDLEQRKQKMEKILEHLKILPAERYEEKLSVRDWHKADPSAVYILKGVSESGKWQTELVSYIDWENANKKRTRAKLEIEENLIKNGDIVVVQNSIIEKKLYRKEEQGYAYLGEVKNLSISELKKITEKYNLEELMQRKEERPGNKARKRMKP